MLMKTSVGVLFGLLAVGAVAAERASLRLMQTIPLAGVKGRFDHFALDRKAQRLLVAALGHDTVEVLDITAGKRLQTIAGLREPQGVAYLADRNQIVVASGGDGTVKFFNGSTYALEQTLRSLDDADNVRFDAAEGTVYVGYGDGGLAVIDAVAAKPTAVIPLAGHPESFQLEQRGPRIFVNVPDARHVAVVDRRRRSVVATWPMIDFQANFPLALDEAHHRVFVGCRRPARLVVFDADSGRRVADLAISGDADDLFYDSARKRLYLSCGAGLVDVIEQRDADHYLLRERIPTAEGARTAGFVPELGALFLAVPLRGKQDAEIRRYQVE